MNPAVKNKSIPSNKRLYTISGTCHTLSISRATCYRLIDDGSLRRIYVRGAPRIIGEDIERLAQVPEMAEAG